MRTRGTFVIDPLDSAGAVVRVKIEYARLGGGVASTRRFLAYLQRPGTAEDGDRAPLFTGTRCQLDPKRFIALANRDPFQFRLVLSPDDGYRLDLQAYARAWMALVERDLQTSVDWLAAAHYNEPDHLHVHLVIRPRDATGHLFRLSRDYLSNGLRLRAQQLEVRMADGLSPRMAR